MKRSFACRLAARPWTAAGEPSRCSAADHFLSKRNKAAPIFGAALSISSRSPFHLSCPRVHDVIQIAEQFTFITMPVEAQRLPAQHRGLKGALVSFEVLHCAN